MAANVDNACVSTAAGYGESRTDRAKHYGSLGSSLVAQDVPFSFYERKGASMSARQSPGLTASKSRNKKSQNLAGNNVDPSEEGPFASKTGRVLRERLLSDRDVALRYKVEKQTIWRWAKTSNSFPKPIKVEGTTRWSELELDEHDRKLKEARR